MARFIPGDILRVNMTVAADHFDGCKHTTVYQSMMDAAAKHRFKVLSADPLQYNLLRLDDNVQYTSPVSEVEQYFEKDEN